MIGARYAGLTADMPRARARPFRRSEGPRRTGWSRRSSCSTASRRAAARRPRGSGSGRDARRAIRDRGAQAVVLRVAGLGRAWIVVRAAYRGAWVADAGAADLDAVAEVAIAARRAVRHRCVIAARRRVAQVAPARARLTGGRAGRRSARGDRKSTRLN